MIYYIYIIIYITAYLYIYIYVTTVQICPALSKYMDMVVSNKQTSTPIENKRDPACSSTPSNAGNAPEEGKKRATRGN
jgi:hypothetical protein